GAAVAALMPEALTAVQAQDIRLEEIVVTARKREENLMTVPLAITAFSAADIEARNIKQLNDISSFTPSFSFSNQQGGSGRNDRSTNSLVFRGLFLNNNFGIAAGGQMFIDGAPIIGAQAPTITDVGRIEVLKGPQSAYFGRSTFSGAINFIMREPTDEFAGRVIAEYGRYGSNEQVLSLEGPIVRDKFAIRVSGRHWHEGGAYRNFSEPEQKLGNRTTNSVSASLVFTPSDNLKVKSYINYFENADGAPAQAALKQDQFNGVARIDKTCGPLAPPTVAPTSPLFRSQSGYFCGTLPSVSELPRNIISGDYDINAVLRNTLFNPNPNWLIFDPTFIEGHAHRRKAFQADVRLDYDTTDGYTFSALAAYHNDKSSNLIDLNYRDGRDRPNPLFISATATPTRLPWRNTLLLSQAKLRDWSLELRVNSPQEQKLRWTAGLNYLDAFSPGGTVYGNLIAGPFFTAAITEQQAKTPAVFGAVYFDFTPDLTLSAEARYQWDKIAQQPIIGTNGLPVTGAAATRLKETYTSFSPRVSIDYKYAENSTVYALFSRGYRPGGFNAGLVTSTPAVIAALQAVVPNAGTSFEEEKIDNYEIGIKSTWLDGRARTTIALFYMDWLNGQVGNSIPVQVGGVANLIGLTINTGKAQLKGVEFEGQIQATENLSLSATFGLNDTEVKSLGLGGTSNCSDCNFVYGSFEGAIGNQLPTTPKYTWTLSGEYVDELTSKYDWYSRVDYTHTGKKQTDFSNVAQVAAADTVNFRIGLRNETMSLEAFVTNAFDNDEILHGLLGIDVFTFLAPPGNRNEIRISLPRPRSYGIRASYNF
ncbi:MAG: TonB-dependent receptor, partial [Rhodospirillaceae bacterium]|nr:TonB-dependent receptor [Rhodospirillaceae bacterium]